MAEPGLNLDSNLRYRVVATGNRYHWIDRCTQLPVRFSGGGKALFKSLDQAIAAFVDGKLTVKQNVELKPTTTND